MKGLSLLCLLAIASQAAETETDINDEVNRKVILDHQSVIEIISDIRFKSVQNQ